MNFNDVEHDLQQLIGLRLNSITPGSEIVLLEVNASQNRVLLQTSSGKTKSRPFDELKRIWDEMQKAPAVHVDRVLNGSGSSRNQPETILANLPYVEWLRLDGKKHISFVGQNTHPFGTLKEMQDMDAVAVANRQHAMTNNKAISAVVVTWDISAEISEFQQICSGATKAVEQGVYQVETDSELILFVTPAVVSLAEGTYCVLNSRCNAVGLNTVEILGRNYTLLNQGRGRFLLK